MHKLLGPKVKYRRGHCMYIYFSNLNVTEYKSLERNTQIQQYPGLKFFVKKIKFEGCLQIRCEYDLNTLI